MPRCPYCDAEYMPGEIYCKSCNEDLSALDLQPVSADPEPLESQSAFTAAPPQTTQSPAPPVDLSDRDAPVALPEVPVIPEVPLALTETQAPETLTPTGDRVGSRERVEPAVPRPVGPVCPGCGMTNEMDSKFCDGCGKPLGGNCPSCQGTNRPGAKFCQQCGHRLGEVAPAPVPAAPSASLPVSHVHPVAAMLHYALVLLNKEGREVSRFPLREGVNQVGAKSAGEGIMPEVDLSAEDNQQVISRRHAILRVAGDRVTLADCGSTNGTRVDGTRIATVEVPVDERSSIMFGNLHAKLVRV